jgi:hypothetical protein
MPFFTGGATFARFKVLGPAPRAWTPEHIDLLSQHAAGKRRMLSGDGVEAGWTAGRHVLDTDFTWEKQVVNDLLYFGLRLDSMKLPADLLKAYYEIDLAALAKNNPSGFASAKQKREARESARDRLEEEAKDGRHTKRKVTEVVWDRLSNEVWFGTASASNIDRLIVLFKDTFGLGFEAVTAGRRAYALSELDERTRAVDDLMPAAFPGRGSTEVTWIPDDADRSWLGNEFILWLWFQCNDDESTFKLRDGSEATVMIARSLYLECPRGMTGSDTIKHEGPTSLPEAMRAIQAGKLPRKCGLTVVRHGVQYGFTLHAETLAVGSAKIPAPEEEEPRSRLEARAQQLRDLTESIDLLYDAFLRVRLSPEWVGQLSRMQRWLSREERRAA